ncbi:hypothetical protein SOVF_010130 [Spinacia oleracea]|nr:hypothetical protein SOVF_010130 [Spinacia oleracea]
MLTVSILQTLANQTLLQNPSSSPFSSPHLFLHPPANSINCPISPMHLVVGLGTLAVPGTKRQYGR